MPGMDHQWRLRLKTVFAHMNSIGNRAGNEKWLEKKESDISFSQGTLSVTGSPERDEEQGLCVVQVVEGVI